MVHAATGVWIEVDDRGGGEEGAEVREREEGEEYDDDYDDDDDDYHDVGPFRGEGDGKGMYLPGHGIHRRHRGRT